MFKVVDNVYLTYALLADRYYDVMLDEINDEMLKSSEHRDFIVNSLIHLKVADKIK